MEDDEFDRHLRQAEQAFPSLLRLEKIEGVCHTLGEMVMLFESEESVSAPEFLPELIGTSERLFKELKQSIYYTIVSEAIGRSAALGGEASADVSIAEGPARFYHSLDEALGEWCTITNCRRLSLKLRQFSDELKSRKGQTA